MSWENLPPLSNQSRRPPLGRWSASAEPARWQPRPPLGRWGASTSPPSVMAKPCLGFQRSPLGSPLETPGGQSSASFSFSPKISQALISATDGPSPAAPPDVAAPVRSPHPETTPSTPSSAPAQYIQRQPLGYRQPLGQLHPDLSPIPEPSNVPEALLPEPGQSAQPPTESPPLLPEPTAASQAIQRQPQAPPASTAPATGAPGLPDLSSPAPGEVSSSIESPTAVDSPSPLPPLQRQVEPDQSGDGEMPPGDSSTDTRPKSVPERFANRRATPSPQSPEVQAVPAPPLREDQSPPLPTVPTQGATPAPGNLEGDAPALQTQPAAAEPDLSEPTVIREEIYPGITPSPSPPSPPINAIAEGSALQASPEPPVPLSPQPPSATESLGQETSLPERLALGEVQPAEQPAEQSVEASSSQAISPAPPPLQAAPAPADSASTATSPDGALPLAAAPTPPIANADPVQADSFAETVRPSQPLAATEPASDFSAQNVSAQTFSAQTDLPSQSPAAAEPVDDSLFLAPESPGPEPVRPVQRGESLSPALPPEAPPSSPGLPLQPAPETAPSSTAPSDIPAASSPTSPALPTPAESSANSLAVGNRPSQAIRDAIPARIARTTDPAISPPPSEPLALDAIQASFTSPASDSAQNPQPSLPGLPPLASLEGEPSSPLDSDSAVDIPSSSDFGDVDVAPASSPDSLRLSPSNTLPGREVPLRSEPIATANPAVARTELEGTEGPQQLIQPLPQPGVEPPAQPPAVSRISDHATSDHPSDPPLQRKASSPDAAEPWQHQFALGAATAPPTPETPTTAATPPQSEPEPTVHHLGAPAVSAEAPALKTSEVSAEQMEQLARVCYSLVRSRLDLTHEAHYGLFPPRPPWVDVVYLPLVTDPTDPGVQTSPDLNLDLDALSLGLEEAIATLVDEAQAMVHQHWQVEQERSRFQYTTRLRR